MANPLVPTAYDVVMTILVSLLVVGIVVAVVMLLRRSGARQEAPPGTRQLDAAQTEPRR